MQKNALKPEISLKSRHFSLLHTKAILALSQTVFYSRIPFPGCTSSDTTASHCIELHRTAPVGLHFGEEKFAQERSMKLATRSVPCRPTCRSHYIPSSRGAAGPGRAGAAGGGAGGGRRLLLLQSLQQAPATGGSSQQSSVAGSGRGERLFPLAASLACAVLSAMDLRAVSE